MNNLTSALRTGHYAKKQIYSNDWLISWSHRSRFQTGLRLARRFRGLRVLDYGCGDGSFLAMLMASDAGPSSAIGAEANSDLVNDCCSRLGIRPNLSFVRQDELGGPEHVGHYDALVCMEVLEHVLDVEGLIERFKALLAPAGKLLISVPVETGLPLVAKQTLRRIAGWRGIGDYPGTSSYTLGEFAMSILANRPSQHIKRPVFHNADGDPVSRS